MRVMLVTLLAAAVALPLAAAAGPVVSPAEITLHVGEAAILTGYQNAGGLSQGFPYHYDFLSDLPAVAAVRGFASGKATTYPDPIPHNGEIFVTALQAGVAHVRIRDYPLDLATITVLPQIGLVEIHAATAVVTPGQPVVLTAVVRGYDQQATFEWYRGRTDDTTCRIQASTDPQVSFVAQHPTEYVWVRASAGPFTGSAEIRLAAAPPGRRRAAKH